MSRLKSNNINFDDDDFLVEIGDNSVQSIEQQENFDEINNDTELIEDDNQIDEKQLIINQAKEQAQNMIEHAQIEANEIIEKANNEIELKKAEIIEHAQKEANEIIENAKNNSSKEANELVENSKENIEKERIEITKKGYEEGYQDGQEKIQEELEEKINAFDIFCKNQYAVRDKILKSANKDILDLILNISKKILLKELDSSTIEKIIKSAISTLEKKENITIILSEKYAKMLYELQKKSLADEIEFNFEDFNKYENFDVVYNKDFNEDTIIVENLKERLDASVNSQLDVIIRNIYDNSQNGKIDLEQYQEDETN